MVAAGPATAEYRALLKKYEEERSARRIAKEFLALAERHPQEPEALDALLWVVNRVKGKTDTTKALQLLLKSHIQKQKLGQALQSIASSRSPAAEAVLRAMLEKSRSTVVQAQACYYLAALLEIEANLVTQLKAQPELAPRVLQYYGRDYGAHLKNLELESLAQQREAVYERMLRTFSTALAPDGTPLKEVARSQLFAIRHLSVGKVAPDIKGEDIDGDPFKLSDYRGKVVMLTFWGHW